MYAVVGCTDCHALWLLSDPDRAETARCPNCARQHRTAKLRRFFESADREAARQARSAMLADRSGANVDELESVSAMEARLDEAGVDDREYLEGAGVDADAVAAAGERDGDRRSRDEVVRDAVRTADRPTAEEVVEAASEHGVDPEFVRSYLERLVRRGEATEHRGTYRLL